MAKSNLAAFPGSLFDDPEPVKTEPVKTEPVKTEPVKTEPVKTEPVKTPTRGRTWVEALRQQIVRDEVALLEGEWGPAEFFRGRIADYRAELARVKDGPPEGRTG